MRAGFPTACCFARGYHAQKPSENEGPDNFFVNWNRLLAMCAARVVKSPRYKMTSVSTK